MAQREFDELSREECFALLGQQRVGRLVYQDEIGPVAVPVNYALAGENIVFRVEGGSKRLAMGQPVLAFEVDHIDNDARSGWSVIARGKGHEVGMDEVPQLLHDMPAGPPLPWGTGIHNVWLQIAVDTVTGRRLAGRATPLVS